MEMAIYSDFEPRKGKAHKKREAGILIGTERSKEAEKATAAGADKAAVPESAHPVVVVASAGEPADRRLPDQAQLERIQRLPDEEIRELVVARVPPNPRLVLAAYEEDGRKEVVRVWVGVHRNFKMRMTLRAWRGADENEPWRLIGKSPRLPGRW